MTVPASDRPPARVAMFCSTEDHVGQTTTLVNVALVLAERGRRVLIVDDRGGQVRARHYLDALARSSHESAPVTPYVGHVTQQGHAAGAAVPVAEYETRAGSGRVGLITIDSPDGAGLARFARPGSPERRAFAGYHYVLIDAPMTWTDAELDGIGGLPDLVVACFTLNSWSIEGAADLARRVRARAAKPVTVIAAGLKADTQMRDQLRTARAFVRTVFEGGSDDGFHYVEIPYHASYVNAKHLPAEPAPGTAKGLRANFAQLADELDVRRPTEISRATVVYTPRHHRWAEWITAQLAGCDIEATALPAARFNGLPPAPGSALLMIAPTDADEHAVGVLARLLHPGIRLVLVDELTPAPRLSHHEQLDLRRTTEPEAVVRLRRALRLRPAEGSAAVSVPFPRLPERANLAPRDPGFVGRDAVIDAVRAALRSGGGACVLHGEPGIGKSALVREFCHRYGGDYDLVWSLSATSRESVQDGLRELADRLDLPGTGDVVASVLAKLAGADVGRWLLVYDDAAGRGVLDGLVPENTTHGDIVVTARAADALPAARPVPVPSLSAAEARAMLSARVQGLTDLHAELVGQTVGYVPLTLGLAAAWLQINVEWEQSENRMPDTAVQKSVARFSEEFRRAQHAVVAEPDGAALPRAMLEMTLDLLARDPGVEVWRREPIGGGGPVWLLETCAILAPGGVPLDLLKAPAMQHALVGVAASAPSALSDPLVIDVVLWSLARHGLIEVDLSRSISRVRQHPVLSELVVGRMGAARRDARVKELREVLSRYSAEAKAGGRRREDAVAESHLAVLTPWRDRRPEVRQWLLRQLLHLVRRYDRLSLERALELGKEAEAAWRDDDDSPEYLRLLDLLAQIHRELRQYPEARRRARQALRAQRAILGLDHPRSLLSGDHYGSVLRTMGEFRQARTEVARVLRSLRRLLGPGHPAALQVEHNLAFAEVLTDNPRSALKRLQDQFNQLRAMGGEYDEEAWRIANTLAYCHRVLGQYQESFSLLKGFLRRRGLLEAGNVPAREALLAEIGLAVSERRLRLRHRGPEAARERHERVLADLLKNQGEDALATVACLAGLAADLHSLGKHLDAVEHASRCRATLSRRLGADHPFTHACAVNLSVYRRAVGGADDVAEAEELARNSHERLTARLGATHPWTLAAATSLANLAVDRGDLEYAAALDEEVVHGFDELGLASHPDRGLAARNRDDSQARQRSEPTRDRPPRDDIDVELPGGI